MQNFSVFVSAVAIGVCLQPSISLRLLRPRHQPYLIHFKHWLEEVGAAMVQYSGELVEAGVVEEAFIIQLRLINLDRTPLIAHHELLERHEAHVPAVAFFVGDEFGDGGGFLEHGAHLKLPNATINFTIPKERPPVFKMLWLVGRHGHLADVCYHVIVVYGVVDELRLIMSIKQIKQLRLFPHGISSKDEIVFVLVPVDVSDAEVVVFGHFEGSLVFHWFFFFSINLFMDMIYD